MPYIWTEPQLILEHQGDSVYNTYKDENWEHPHSCRHTTDVAEQATSFDIHDLKSYQSREDSITILRRLIELGEITIPPEEE